MANISKITIPNGNNTTTYDLKDSDAIHSSEDFLTTTIVPVESLETYNKEILGANDLVSIGAITINSTSVDKYRLSLTGVVNGLTATGQVAATIDGLTSDGQEVLTGLEKEMIFHI